MLHNDINLLKQELKEKAIKAIEAMRSDEKLKEMGVSGIAISETLRDLSTQMAYYARGRMTTPDVVAMYAAAGLYAIGEKEAQNKITWTLQSKHLKGEAIDIIPTRAGVYWWGAPSEVWKRIGEIGKECGMKWGGDWKQTDTPHFEI